jgi:hypothetical protein
MSPWRGEAARNERVRGDWSADNGRVRGKFAADIER